MAKLQLLSGLYTCNESSAQVKTALILGAENLQICVQSGMCVTKIPDLAGVAKCFVKH